MVEVVRRQRTVRRDCARWRAFVERALKVVPAKGAGVTVAFVSDSRMRELNRRWRGKEGTTDVLSFPSGQEEFERSEGTTLGDVVVSVEQAARQAARRRIFMGTPSIRKRLATELSRGGETSGFASPPRDGFAPGSR